MLLELAIFILFIIFIITVCIALIYFGLFESVEVKVGKPPFNFGNRIIGYKKEIGKYNDAGGLFTEVNNLVPQLNSIGIFYYDNDTNEVCKYSVGAILNQENILRESEMEILKKKGFQFGQLPDVDHVVYATFPFKGVFSVVIAIRRVYPIIKSYIKDHNLCAHPAIEIYDENNIHFIWPLAKQDHFHQFQEVKINLDSDESNDESYETYADKVRNKRRFLFKQDSTSSSFEELQAEDQD